MARRALPITHLYSLNGGWRKTPRTPLTRDTAIRLRAEGFTMIRARKGWFSQREISLDQFLYRGGVEGAWRGSRSRRS